MIAVTRKSQLSGKESTQVLDITEDQLMAYMRGALLQEAFPHLSADDREFIKTGITPTEWAEMFGPEEE